MSATNVVVKYKTVKTYCSCCYQKLPDPKVSKEREFIISKDDVLNWAEWEEIVKYPEDVERMIPEYVHETISFHATGSEERIIVEQGELDRVKEFILQAFVA